jgi:hypothetical protein
MRVVDAAWADVLQRARRLRRRRRAAVVVAGAVVALAGALAASGQIGTLLDHSREPHLVLLARIDGAAVEVDLQHALVTVGRDGFALEPYATPSGGLRSTYPARWFFRGRGGRALAAVGGGRTVVLCRSCRAADSGRIDLPRRLAAALVRRRGVVTYGSARARMTLDARRLHRGLRCARTAPPRRCVLVYTGR